MEVLYALGGGMGHLMRARALAKMLGQPATILHQARHDPGGAARAVRLPPDADAAWVRRWLCAALAGGGRLLVDTFPGGVAHELDDETLGAASRTVLVRRHLRAGSYPGYDALAERFDEHWLPYPPDRCAWEGAAAGRHVGPLVRDLPIADGPPAPVAVIGDARKLPPGWRSLLPEDTVWIDRFVQRLPAARRYLCVGAGHNLCWELIGAGVAALHLPLARRYDDQHRRALRLGRAALRRDDVASFLAGGA